MMVTMLAVSNDVSRHRYGIRDIRPCALLCLAFFFSLAFTPAAAQNYSRQPWNYIRNSHVRFNTVKVGDNMVNNITFMDHFGYLRSWQLRYPADEVIDLGVEFGIPKAVFQPYFSWERKAMEKTVRAGLFTMQRGVIKVDKSRVVSQSAELICKPIAQSIAATLSSIHRDTRINRIRMAMKFVQDIPYGVPNFDDQDWYFGGVIPPPLIMMFGYGDCDSKSILFAGILSYLIDYRDVIFLNTSSHVLTAVRCDGVTGTYMEHGHKKYLLTETAGPRRADIGEDCSGYTSYRIEPLLWHGSRVPVVIPYGSSSSDRVSTSIASRVTRTPPMTTNSSGRSGSSGVSMNTSGSRSRTGNSGATGNTSSCGGTGSGNQGASSSSWREKDLSPDVSGSRALLKIGGGVGYHQGSVKTPVEDWTMKYPVLLVHGCLGIPLSENHLLVFYVTGGTTEYPSLTRLLQDQGAQYEIRKAKDFYPFWEYEAGLLLFRFLRISAGKGTQEFLAIDGLVDRSIEFDYYSASAGLDLRFGVIGFGFTGTMLFGEQYKKRILRTTMAVNLYLSK